MQFTHRRPPPARLFMRHRFLLVLLACSSATLPSNAAAEEVLDFRRDIRPILSDACFQCHGPDEQKRKGKLRLDTREGAFGDRGGHAAFVPGKPDESEALKRMLTERASKRMPPK